MTPHWHMRGERSTARDLTTLFSRCSAGDKSAREAIILRFLPLAGRLAGIYEGRGEPIEDLRQVASVGLINAVDRYSPERGNAFSVYARPVILGEIRRYFRDATWRLHVPRQLRDRAERVNRAEKELRVSSDPAGPEAIANLLGIASEELAEARLANEAYSPRSLDATFVGPDGNAGSLHELVGVDESEYDGVEMSVGIQRALRTLNPRHQKVLLLRLAWELSQAEIASIVGLSQMQVSRVLRKASATVTTSCGLSVSV